MNTQFLKNNFGWGFTLWLFGYLASFILFFMVPPNYIGWIIMPIGIVATVWVLLKKITVTEIGQYTVMGIIWLFIAVLLDYLLIIKALNPADGYYKPAVYVYYVLTFFLPPAVGFYKQKNIT